MEIIILILKLGKLRHRKVICSRSNSKLQRSCNLIPGLANGKPHGLLNCVILSEHVHDPSMWTLTYFSPFCLSCCYESDMNDMKSSHISMSSVYSWFLALDWFAPPLEYLFCLLCKLLMYILYFLWDMYLPTHYE